MLDTRSAVIDRLIDSYERYYDIFRYDDPDSPVAARCDYFEHSEKFFLSKKVELWSADTEEFLYILDIPRLTLELFEQWRDWVNEDGLPRLNIGPGHMSSAITSVFVCDTCDPEARRALEKCRISKSFHFSLYGWMDYHALLVEVGEQRVSANASAAQSVKMIKSVLGLVPRKNKKKGVKG